MCPPNLIVYPYFKVSFLYHNNIIELKGSATIGITE